MSKKINVKGLFKKFRHKYRLSIYRDATYEEVLNLRLSKFNVFTLVGGLILIFLIIVISLIVYTPIREFIPGYPDSKTLASIYRNAIMLDSLEYEIFKRDRYFENMKKVIKGEVPDNFENYSDTGRKYENITFTRSVEDSLLRLMIEQEGYNISSAGAKTKESSVNLTHFFPPVRGMVTNSFNATGNHYGIDIVAAPNEVVKATLDGTIILASWTLETGYVILIQHDNNILSVYKHNAELLKRQGDFVKVGEPIAIIGNSGELTTGPHLHFELWHNITPLNPIEYVTF